MERAIFTIDKSKKSKQFHAPAVRTSVSAVLLSQPRTLDDCESTRDRDGCTPYGGIEVLGICASMSASSPVDPCPKMSHPSLCSSSPR